MKTKTFS